MRETHISRLASVQMAHVGYILLERALDLLVLGENGFDRVVIVLHVIVYAIPVLRRLVGADS